MQMIKIDLEMLKQTAISEVATLNELMNQNRKITTN